MQKLCHYIVHPYDPKRENLNLYGRRLRANKGKVGRCFEPGDTRAIDEQLGKPAAPPAQKPKAEADDDAEPELV